MARGCALVALGAFAMCVSPVAAAWGPEGHEVVGAIAQTLLAGSPAEAEVTALLGTLGLQQAAVWADCAKGVQSTDDVHFTYVADDVRYPECKVFGTPEDKAAFERFVAANWKQCGTAHGTEMCHNQYHYADISNRRSRYATTEVGADDHDVVHSIAAAIAVLQGSSAPAPFDIADKHEALLLLAHYVGDIEQPLHVEAIYLNAKGKSVDPDAIGYSVENDTTGGNSIFDGRERLHHEWDSIPLDDDVGGAAFASLLTMARAVRVTSGDLSTWSTRWASDTVKVGHAAFVGLRYAPMKTTPGEPPAWTVSGTQASTYVARADALKAQQLAKGGARLAQVLQAIWPLTR